MPHSNWSYYFFNILSLTNKQKTDSSIVKPVFLTGRKNKRRNSNDMKRSLFIKYVLPYIQWYALMIFLSIVIDYFLHGKTHQSGIRYFGSFCAGEKKMPNLSKS